MVLVLELSLIFSLRSRRFLFLLLLVRRWLLPERWLFTLPDLVILKRFRADLLVFSLGMTLTLSYSGEFG
jgi:hypothetical protein